VSSGRKSRGPPCRRADPARKPTIPTHPPIMNNDAIHAAMATWAARALPARLDVITTAKLLGFAEHDIQILMGVGKLTPLGSPAPNAPKWFAAMEIIQLAADNEWLHKATREVSKYWRHKRERQLMRRGRCGAGERESAAGAAGKPSPDSSPKSSPGRRQGGDKATPAGDQQGAAQSA
jgi:hypothetical protein